LFLKCLFFELFSNFPKSIFFFLFFKCLFSNYFQFFLNLFFLPMFFFMIFNDTKNVIKIMIYVFEIKIFHTIMSHYLIHGAIVFKYSVKLYF
jgi:hypothetical protein